MRTRPAIAVVVVFALACPAVARAAPQETAAKPQQQSPPKTQAASSDAVVESMGISLDRIRRQLRETPPTVGPWLARLEYHIEVVAKAPPIEILKGFNIGPSSAVQYGGMTHLEFLKITAPPWRPW